MPHGTAFAILMQTAYLKYCCMVDGCNVCGKNYSHLFLLLCWAILHQWHNICCIMYSREVMNL